jgi:riboflavin synthase
MFTGIVQAQCEVMSVTTDGGVARFVVDLGQLADGLQLGASVANNGTCLTASAIEGTLVSFDVIGETLDMTNLGDVEVGDRINIERSLKFGDELGGHILSGHVSGTVVVSEIVKDGNNRTMWFDVDAEHMPFLLWKGFVALDGASLTISRLDRGSNRLAVSLIPETLERTTFGRLEIGDRVNLELDSQTQSIVETVRNVLADPDLRDQILDQAIPE